MKLKLSCQIKALNLYQHIT